MWVVQWVDDIPRCPVCGSFKFDASFELISAGEWRLDSLFCYECETKLSWDDRLEKYLRGEKWTVRGKVT